MMVQKTDTQKNDPQRAQLVKSVLEKFEILKISTFKQKKLLKLLAILITFVLSTFE